MSARILSVSLGTKTEAAPVSKTTTARGNTTTDSEVPDVDETDSLTLCTVQLQCSAVPEIGMDAPLDLARGSVLWASGWPADSAR